MGILTTGAFVEADRNSLIGQYIGQTGPKTLEKIEEASGGVLFIDEAYSLYHEDDQRDFGQEAITTLLKAMEDKRDDLIVIVAGYTNEMNHFIDSNPGLKSRFTTYIEFPDYSPDELMTIFRSMCKDEKWILNSDANDCLYEMLEKIYNNKTKDFGNARTVRNIFQKICMTQNNRISNTPNIKSLSNEEIMTINKDDIIEASKYFLKEGAYHA
jgi:DNA-binding NtrC family response regulator